jgi:outer membrane protein OmpA-like peptidoglycan-associated protein
MSNEIHSSFLISELVSKGGRFIKVSAENYMEKILPIEELKKMQMARIELVQAGMGNSFLLENIMFARGKAELQGESFKVKLIELADFMKKNPMLKIRINGHTDHAGDPSLNKSLSLQRAAAVRKFLIDQGISPDHLRTSGWGGSKPIAPNDTEEGRAKNRRVEIQFEK